MFTGIVEEVGAVKSITTSHVSSKIEIAANAVLIDVKLGDSISVNGVCLTVESYGKGFFRADILTETINKTSLGGLSKGSQVNLERALKLSDRLGGHFVTGHIDGVGIVDNVTVSGADRVVKVKCSQDLSDHIVKKGSVAVDGVSLTIADNADKCFSVHLTGFTLMNTILRETKKGDKVNIETDIIGKYVDKSMKNTKNTKITEELLRKKGII